MPAEAVGGRAPRTAHLPGEPGIWMFIFGDMLIFSLLFVVYLNSRAQNVALFNASQAHLSQLFGALNTVFMLSSSWFVAMAVQAARLNLARAVPVLFALAFLCGFGFGVDKFLEWGEKIRAGIGLNDSGEFFMYYYILTGIHFMHVLIGMGVLAWLAHYSRAGGFDDAKLRNLESGASFWHVVDLLWIVLFALLYLVR